MPIGKKIHDVMSRKFKDKKHRSNKIIKATEPPTIDQFKKNKVVRAKSLNVHIVDLAGPRCISPNEGIPAVNAKSGQELVKKAVTKVRPKNIILSGSIGAIDEHSSKNQKKCSVCRKTGHTKRTCPN